MPRKRHDLPHAGMLMLVLVVLALYWAPVAHGYGCDGIQIESISALHFGTLRVQRNTTGWVLVDVGGGYLTSEGTAVSSRSLPVPGRIRVNAPSERTLLLHLVMPADAVVLTHGVQSRLRAVTLGRGMQPLQREGEFWRLEMPKSPVGDESVEVELSIGGELGFDRVTRPDEFAIRLRVECQGSR